MSADGDTNLGACIPNENNYLRLAIYARLDLLL